MIDLDRITPNPIRSIDGNNINDLRESIRTYGVLQPILVRPKDRTFEVVFGNHRFYAAKGAGLTEIPCIIQHLSDEQAILVSLVENIQRKELNPYEEGRLLSATKRSPRQLAKRLGKSQTYIQQRITIYEGLHPELASKIGQTLTITNAYHLARLPKTKQLSVAERVDAYRHAEERKELQPPSGFGGMPIGYGSVCICPRCGATHKKGEYT